ncbi:hypothetical protein [Streptomyces sp. SID8352]|uniref:hypothetical protein n=1 Tax=Streptomyces sp. SID8352 TaxID=2690338 RepID=UPI00136E014B|nr:hypothetical protein [Streptomyces sp. SID8352]MYU24508.1 hypothetical protein [Streptomyces sp. SID8352]
MSHAIPTTPQDNPADTIMAALAHGMTGHPENAAPLFESFILGGRGPALGLCAALAEVIVRMGHQPLPKDGGFGLLVYDSRTGKHVNVTALPPGVRFAAQFTAAWANHQRDTAAAHFDALITPGTDEAALALAAGIRALFDMAVATLAAKTGRTP